MLRTECSRMRSMAVCSLPKMPSLIWAAGVTFKSALASVQNCSWEAVSFMDAGKSRMRSRLGLGLQADQNVDRPPKNGQDPWQNWSSLVSKVLRERVQGNVSEGPPRTILKGMGRFWKWEGSQKPGNQSKHETTAPRLTIRETNRRLLTSTLQAKNLGTRVKIEYLLNECQSSKARTDNDVIKVSVGQYLPPSLVTA